MTLSQVLSALLLALPAYVLYRRLAATPPTAPNPTNEQNEKKEEEKDEPKSIMQPPRNDLPPPKDDPFTLAQLREFDGSDPSKPLYVSIKGACVLFPAARRAG